MKASAKDLRWILFLLALSVCVTLNSLYIKSSVVGIPLSIAFFIVSSAMAGEVFFPEENKVFKVTLGFAVFLTLTALSGSLFIVSGQFSRVLSLIMVCVIGLVFGVLSLRIKDEREGWSLDPKAGERLRARGEGLPVYLASGAFMIFVALAFWALATARTSEGVTSVWLTIPSYFLPAFFVCSLLLMFVLFFTRAHIGLKLFLIFVYSFLARSLFWIVWYPGRYGDPWRHLGNSRFIDRTGMPYSHSKLLQEFLVHDLIKNKAQYGPLVLVTRMFNVDIYWVHILLIPLLWSFLVPLFSYKLAEMLAKKRSEKLPLITAFVASLIPSLVIWGTVSVPNSLGYILFLFVVFLMFYWVRTGKRRIWVLSLFVAATTLFAHVLPAIFAFMFFLLVTVLRGSSRVTLKVIFYLLLFPLYPLALYLFNVQLLAGDLLALESLVSFQSTVATVMTFVGLLGVVLALRNQYVDRRNVLLVFGLYVIVVSEYYLSMYATSGLPYGAHRILVMADLLLLPFVALAVIEVADILTAGRPSTLLKKAKAKLLTHGLLPRSAGFALMCLVLSAQATLALYQAYPHEEGTPIQPSVYMMEAVYYINSTAPRPYVVLCDTQLANIAVGLLGIDYGYAGGGRGLFGMPEFSYPTIVLYGRMVISPSLSIMQEAIDLVEWAEVAYFVVSIMSEDFERAVEETSVYLPVEAAFGESFGKELPWKLYIFRYPIPAVTGVGPSLKVVVDDSESIDTPTTFSYVHRGDVDYTVSLSGYSSYNITEYPDHWIFSDLTVDGVSRSFDEVSDIDEFIFVSALDPNNVLNVTWKADDLHPNVGWKEVSFKSGWQRHPRYGGTIRPNITTYGNILEMSWNFTSGPYQYYYYVKPCNVSTDDYPHMSVRWKSTGPLAIVAVYFDDSALDIVPPSSKSLQWTTTIKQLPPSKNITMVMVGITNLENKEISGIGTVSFDFILISGEA